MAATIWFRILFLRGAVLVDNYLSGSVSRPSGKVEKPPDALNRMFEKHVERAIELSEAAVEKVPDDADAHYELGVAVRLAASYRASIGAGSHSARCGTRSEPTRRTSGCSSSTRAVMMRSC